MRTDDLGIPGGGAWPKGRGQWPSLVIKAPTLLCSFPLTPGVARRAEALSQTVSTCPEVALAGAQRVRRLMKLSAHLHTTSLTWRLNSCFRVRKDSHVWFVCSICIFSPPAGKALKTRVKVHI